MNDDLDINLPADADDLSKHAPALFALKGTETGFVVPALYFEELSELVIAKTSIPEDGGLTVPENYFEELTSIVQAKTFLSTFDGAFIDRSREAQSDKVIADGLTVPENYFEEFGANLESQIALESLLPKAEAEVPEGYFSEMENELHVHIALDNVKQDEGFVVPEGYFENLSSRVLAETVLDKDNINNDEVPAGYFDALPEKVMSRIEGDKKEEGGRVIVFAQWKKYTAITAVAAAVALVVVFTWTFIGTSENGNGGLQLASNSKGLVPDNYVRVTPQPNVDTTPAVISVVPDPIVIVKNPKNPERIKPQQKNEVIMNNEDIIAQSDMMDESMVMDFVAESDMVQPTDEVLDADMMDYLMKDNATLDVFDPGN